MPRTKRTTTEDGLGKIQRNHPIRHSKGMRLLRIWVPDTRQPGFEKEAKRQADLLGGRPEEKEALAFIEAAFVWPEP
ncbi:MAG: antitoxin MazE family protein [Magnetococcales bacterium]|nr:antitoxin MazE family protein [Magnetococcales bacterium]